MVSQGMAGSRSEARRLIDQQGVRLNGTLISDPSHPVTEEAVLQVGKRKYLRIKIG